MLYRGLHEKLRRVRGRAKDHACVVCGEPANEWALKPGTQDLLTDTVKGVVLQYSLDTEAYQPMCFSCHRNLDMPLMCKSGRHVYAETAVSSGGYHRCQACRTEYNRKDYRRRKAVPD